MLENDGISTAVFDARFLKPLDSELIPHLARNCSKVVTIEENALMGGFGSAVLELMERADFRIAIVDFHRTNYFGSAALGLLVEMRKQLRKCNGGMVLCGISDNELEILRVTGLEAMWPICTSRENALRMLRGSGGLSELTAH